MAYTKDIGLRDFYRYYVAFSKKKGREPVSYKVYSNIIKDANLLFREKIVYKSETLILPNQMGHLSIHKFANNYREDNKAKWRVDYKASKEAGHIIYYGAPYGYRWKWDKRTAYLAGKKWYRFKPCRTASRLIADAVNNKQVDYYN